jgi:hypothetical protein
MLTDAYYDTEYKARSSDVNSDFTDISTIDEERNQQQRNVS